MMNRNIKLTKEEKEIERALLKDEYISVEPAEINEIAKSITHRKKDSVLNIRINTEDLKNIKHKAQKFGIRYQTFISEILHKVAL